MFTESNSLKRKAYFGDATTTNKHIKLDYSNTHIVDEQQGDSVILELDVTPSAPLLKKMYKPTISNYIKYYENKELRQILLTKPKISIQLLGESLFEYIVPLLSDSEFHSFVEQCANLNQERHVNSLRQIKQLAENDESVMKLFNVISNNFEKYFSQKWHFYILCFGSDDFKRLKKEVILKCVKQQGFILEHVSNNLRSDREIVLQAVGSYGMALRFASEYLQSDEEIVRAAITENGGALDFASNELKAKKSLKLLAVNKLSHIPKFIIQETDREIILQAVKTYPNIISKVRKEFKSDREIVYASIQKYGTFLNYASRELQLDRDLVLLSIENFSQWGSEYRIPIELYSDKEVVLEGISQQMIKFDDLPNEMKYDKEIILSALKIGLSFKEIPKEMLNDSDIVFEILKQGQYLDKLLQEININEKEWIVEFIKCIKM